MSAVYHCEHVIYGPRSGLSINRRSSLTRLLRPLLFEPQCSLHDRMRKAKGLRQPSQGMLTSLQCHERS